MEQNREKLEKVKKMLQTQFYAPNHVKRYNIDKNIFLNKKNIQLSDWDYFLEITSFVKGTLMQKRWHVLNNISSPIMCKECKTKPVRFLNSIKGYLTFCSTKCQHVSLKKTVSNNYKLKPYILEKRKQTNLKKYGCEHSSQAEVSKEKIRQTFIKKTGYPGPFANPEFNKKIAKQNSENSKEIKNKVKQTNLKKYGKEYYFQTEKFLLEREKTRNWHKDFTKYKYKNTNLYYQGSYELHFLQEAERNNVLEHVQRGFPVKYIFNNKDCIYFPDFFLQKKNLVVEIKSKWTLDRNGNDVLMRERQVAKAKAIESENINYILLLSKKEITDFFKSFS